MGESALSAGNMLTQGRTTPCPIGGGGSQRNRSALFCSASHGKFVGSRLIPLYHPCHYEGRCQLLGCSTNQQIQQSKHTASGPQHTRESTPPPSCRGTPRPIVAGEGYPPPQLAARQILPSDPFDNELSCPSGPPTGTPPLPLLRILTFGGGTERLTSFLQASSGAVLLWLVSRISYLPIRLLLPSEMFSLVCFGLLT